MPIKCTNAETSASLPQGWHGQGQGRAVLHHPRAGDWDQPLPNCCLSPNPSMYREAASAGDARPAGAQGPRAPSLPPHPCTPPSPVQGPAAPTLASPTSRGRTRAMEHVRTVSDRARRGTTRPTAAEGDRARGVTSPQGGGTRADGQRSGRLLLSPGGTRAPSLVAGNPAPEPSGNRDGDSVGTGSARGAVGSSSQGEQELGACASLLGGSWVIRQGA